MPSSTPMDAKYKSLDEALEKYAREAKTVPKIGTVTFLLREHQMFKRHFEPRAVAIGPIHHGPPKYDHAEEIKKRLAAQFIKDIGQPKESLYELIRGKIEELRGCYLADAVKNYQDDELAWILFVDGCALLQFVRYSDSDKADQLGIKMDLVAAAMQDLLLLENQLPYQLLELLEPDKSRLKDWVQNFIKRYMINPEGIQFGELLSEKEPKPTHLLDILRRAYLGAGSNSEAKGLQQQGTNSKAKGLQQQGTNSEAKGLQQQGTNSEAKGPQQQGINSEAEDLEKQRDSGQKESDAKPDNSKRSRWRGLCSKKSKGNNQHPTFRNMMELKAAGVSVETNTNSSHLKDIKFKRLCFRGTLVLPPIKVDDSTAPIFLNLAAYEMCPDFVNNFGIASYICFMDALIDHPEDVKELRKAKVLHNLLGSDEEVAKLFNEISTDLVPDFGIYKNVSEQIQSHFDDKCATWTEQFYHDHFSSPWTFLAFIGVIIGLVLSLLQTLYSMK